MAAEVIYRASEIGGCVKSLIAKRMGFVAAEWPEKTRELFAEGELYEEMVLSRSFPNAFDRQREVELPITARISVVGHIDAHDGYEVIEVKSMSEQTFKDWTERRWDSANPLIDKYAWQTSCYGLALQGPVVLVAKMRTEDRDPTSPEDWFVIEEPRYKQADIRHRVLEVETAARLGELPVVCDVQQYPCPYYWLHEEEPTQELGEVETEAFDAAAGSYVEGMEMGKRAERIKKDARELVGKMVRGRKKVQTEGFYATPYEIKRKVLNKGKLEEQTGVRLADFEEEQVSEGVRIGRREK